MHQDVRLIEAGFAFDPVASVVNTLHLLFFKPVVQVVKYIVAIVLRSKMLIASCPHEERIVRPRNKLNDIARLSMVGGEGHGLLNREHIAHFVDDKTRMLQVFNDSANCRLTKVC